MDRLQHLIDTNRNLFDDGEPKRGHLERFKQKLNHQKPKVLKINYLLKIASVILLAFISSLYLFEKVFESKNKSYTLSQLSQEYKEVEFYFTQQYNTKLNEFNTLKQLDPDLENNLKNEEFKELDSMYTALQKEIKVNRNDERIINAMIEYYQIKIELLNQIIRQLNDVKTEKLQSLKQQSEIEI